MVRALLFDMDGVIVDSNSFHRQAWIDYNGIHGIATTEAMIEKSYGRHTDEIIRLFFGENLTDQEVTRHSAEKEAVYRQLIGPKLESSLVPGIRQFLESHQDLTAAVGTNAIADNVMFVLKETGLLSCFRAVVHGEQITHPKPHPEVYLRAAELLGVAPDECVVFEDSYSGVAAGIAAGMPVIGLQTTHQELPGTVLAIPDFNDKRLLQYLARPENSV